MVGMPVLKPLHDAAGLRRLVVATYQAVSGSGLAGVAELESQLIKTVDGAAALTFDGRAVDFPPPATFADVVAHNVLPLAGYLIDDGSDETSEERSSGTRAARSSDIPGLEVTCTCVRVPVFTGHSLAIVAEFEQPLSPPQATAHPGRCPRRRVGRHPDAAARGGKGRDPGGSYPYGRRRTGPLAFFLSGDNLRKGAALNAVQIAEHLVASGQLA